MISGECAGRATLAPSSCWQDVSRRAERNVTTIGHTIPCLSFTETLRCRYLMKVCTQTGTPQSSCCVGWVFCYVFLKCLYWLLLFQGSDQRIVRHFHFTTWPDFGVPNPPQTLVRFVRAFRDRVGSDQRPIVVHCSAGVGRSGTFICLDRILQSILTSDYVDIFGIVFAMRKGWYFYVCYI